MPSHERSYSFRHAGDDAARSHEAGVLAPGKRTLTEQLPAGEAVQRKPGAAGGAAAPSSAAGAGGGDWMNAAFRPDLFRAQDAVVQRRAGVSAESDPAQVQAAAQRGISGGAQSLPYLDLIQRSFGRHDVSGVKAHLGGEAAEGASAMGAVAFATGDHVAFGGAPDLHTAAHEAAHVVQQRAGVHLKGGVGEEGDEHERHADAVADRVVAGQSAEALLDRYASGGSPAAGRDAPVQGRAVQRAVKARKLGTQDFKSFSTLAALFQLFEIDGAGQQAFALEMKTRMFATNVFPASYKAKYDDTPEIEQEVLRLAVDLDGLIAGAGSSNVVSVTQGKGDELASQLFAIVGAGITAPYVQARCPHFAIAQGVGGQGATDYLTFVKTTRAKLAEYEQAIDHGKYDQKTLDDNARMEHRIEDLKQRAAELEGELKTVLTQHGNPNAVIAKLNRFRTDLAIIEKAMDLEHAVGKRDVQDKLEEISNDQTPHNSYADGGTDDGVSVGEGYENNKACSLFALLALVPGFMGAQNPEQLHHILRRTKKLQNYDQDAIVAQIRFAAGLKPTMQGGRRLDDFIQKEILDKGDGRPSFIADPSGEAHTFAAVWKDGAYRPRDNAANPNTDIMNVSRWKQIPIGTTWML